MVRDFHKYPQPYNTSSQEIITGGAERPQEMLTHSIRGSFLQEWFSPGRPRYGPTSARGIQSHGPTFMSIWPNYVQSEEHDRTKARVG